MRRSARKRSEAKATKSLSALVTFWVGVAISVSMAGYAWVQYMVTPDATVVGLFTRHLWHVAALGVVIYAFSWIVLRRLVLHPLETVYLHLYAVGAGKRTPLDLPTNVTEIQTIVDGVNLMVRRMALGAEGGSFDRAERLLREIRATAKRLPVADADRNAVADLLAQLVELENSLVAIAWTPPVAAPIPATLWRGHRSTAEKEHPSSDAASVPVAAPADPSSSALSGGRPSAALLGRALLAG